MSYFVPPFIEWIYIGLQLVFFIPIYYLIRYYRKTGMFDYLLLAGVFTCLILNLFIGHSFYIPIIPEPMPTIDLLLNLVQSLPYELAFFLIVVYSIRIKWEKSPRVVWWTTILWGSLWLGSPFFFFTFYNTITIQLPEQILILHAIFHWLCYLLALMIGVLAYVTTKQVIEDERVRRAKNLWILGVLIPIIYYIEMILSWLSYWPYYWASLPYEPIGFHLVVRTIGLFSAIFGIIIIAYVTIRYPEAIIFSYAQLIRASKLYQEIASLKSGRPIQEFGMDSLVKYLKSIPPQKLAKLIET